MNRAIILFLILISVLTLSGQDTLYHEYANSTTDYYIHKWNISIDSLPDNYVMEIVDTKGRVKELRFYQNGSMIYDGLYDLMPWIKYEYPDDTTCVEYWFDENGDCDSSLYLELPHKIVYHLSHDQQTILASDIEFCVDTSNYVNDNVAIEEFREWLMRDQNRSRRHYINRYTFSKMKLNGKYPISPEFEIEEIYWDGPEREEIFRILGKKRE